MSTLTRNSVPLHVSPSVRMALAELSTLLGEYGYHQHAREAICAYVAREGTVTGAPGLDAGDEADASMVFVAELEPVPFDSPAWDRDGGIYLDVPMILDGTHPLPRSVPDEATLISHEAPDGRHVALKLIDAGIMPLCGGGPADEPDFNPTAEDLADYHAWSQALEMRRWYTSHPLAEFNADRPDDPPAAA